tara:strand:- start:3385 stop:4299 length:915 start_codon:yes stop_codon:yes gene_type:complete
MIKSKTLTFLFQKLLNDKDIRTLKSNLFYYLIFRLIRNFLAYDLIIKIYNFKVFGSIRKNETSYFLLKKCEFGDIEELETIKKLSKKNKLLFLDCGSNYGFYSFYSASISKNNEVISVEASKKTSEAFKKNLSLNNFLNIKFYNKAISDVDGHIIKFNESENDWESSQVHSDFKLDTVSEVESIKIDTIIKEYNLSKYIAVIKLDLEGHEFGALNGASKFIKQASPLIIIEFSKFIFNKIENIGYLDHFLSINEYSIYDKNKKKISLDQILKMINSLEKRYKTIGNFYLIKNFSNNLKIFLSNE